MYEDEKTTMEEVYEEPIQEATEAKAEVTPDVIYVPAPTESSESGPNKALIALGIGAGLLVAKPAIRKIRSAIDKRKEAKEKAENERIMKVLVANGLVAAPQTQPEATAEPAKETAETKVETADDKKTDTK
ncbi:MAG: hypothetical protein J6U54_03550 [Clostridiales bacterium]|nr:hypothetical protein [Clostridiales bacterium]